MGHITAERGPHEGWMITNSSVRAIPVALFALPTLRTISTLASKPWHLFIYGYGKN